MVLRGSVPSAGLGQGPAAKVHRGDCKIEATSVANQASISCPRETVSLLEQRKQGLDGGAGMRDQLVAAYGPRAHRTSPMAPIGNPVANAARFEVCPAGVTVIGLVRIGSLLISADQLVRRDRVVDIGRRKDRTPHDPAALVHRNMRL